LLPLIETAVPEAPTEGVNDVTIGPTKAELTTKFAVLLAVPFGLVTVTCPVEAPVGITTVRLFDVAEMTVAVTPLIDTTSLPGVVEKPLP
jgi:hypothetical protein